MEKLHQIKTKIEELEKNQKILNVELSKVFSGSSLVSFQFMQNLPKDVFYTIGLNVVSKTKIKTEGSIEYHVDFGKNGIMGAHKHDCIEYGTVLSGRIVELTTDTPYEEGDTFIVHPYTDHAFFSAGGSILNIKFLKPVPNGNFKSNNV